MLVSHVASTCPIGGSQEDEHVSENLGLPILNPHQTRSKPGMASLLGVASHHNHVQSALADREGVAVDLATYTIRDPSPTNKLIKYPTLNSKSLAIRYPRQRSS